jgi:DNA processing protein
MNNDEIILHLSLIDGVGPSTVLQLVKSKPWDMDLTDIYDMNQVEMMKIFQLSSNKAQAIVSGLSDRSQIDRELELIEQCRVQWTTMFNDQYPEMLKHVHLPPPILYWRGMLRTDCTQNVAVVGSRNVNYYGVSVIESIVPGLVGAGWSVVSGGAIGADTVAHKVAINSGGYTIAVLGSGLLNPYPATNKRLFSDVLDKRGALLSIFPMARLLQQGTFLYGIAL